MYFTKATTAALLASAAVLPTTAPALDLRLGGELMYFDYEETDLSGNSLNQETGFIPGLSIAAAHAYRNLNNAIEFSLYGGDVDYDGQTQAGVPHQTTTTETIYRLLYKLSWSPLDTDNAFYGKAYWQQWDRDIQPANNVQGLFERYQWWTLEGGVQIPFIKQEDSSLLLELGLLTTFNGTMSINLTSAGYGEHTLDLGNGVGYAAALKYEITMAGNNRLQFGARINGWEFGRSNSKTISNGINTITITEPDSTTMQTILSASYIHRF
jgi:hypothetical protein